MQSATACPYKDPEYTMAWTRSGLYSLRTDTRNVLTRIIHERFYCNRRYATTTSLQFRYEPS